MAKTWCLTSTETIRLIRDGEKGVRGYGGGGRGRETIIPIATLSPPVIPALSPFLIGRMFVRKLSWKYSANLVGS